MYFCYYGKETLHDPRIDELTLSSPTVELEVNTSGSFTFTINHGHPLFDVIRERDTKNPVSVYQDKELVFFGDVLSIDSDFHLSKKVECRGALGWLNDTIVRPYSTLGTESTNVAPSTVDGYFKWLVENHNKQVESSKKFLVGVNDGSLLEKNNSIYRSSTDYPNTGKTIKEEIIEELGGYVRVRADEPTGHKYIDLLSDMPRVNAQVIDFGVNILDFNKTEATDNLTTFVVPVGAKLSETDYEYNDGYYKTSDSSPNSKKEYFTRKYKKSKEMTSFATGVRYYEKKEETFKTSDSKPYSGVNYYVKQYKQVSITKFAAGKTYYVKDGSSYNVASSYKKGTKYYTMSWAKQSITAFKSGTTYYERETHYVATSDSSPVSGKDYYVIENGKYTSHTDLGRFSRYETYYEYDEGKDESDNKLTIDGLGDDFLGNNYRKRGDMIYSEDAVDTYGWIGSVVEFSDVKDMEKLRASGLSALRGLVSPISTIEVKAIDLAMIKPDYEPILLGDYVRARSKPHGLDSYMLCSKLTINLMQPDQNTFTLGSTFEVLTGVQNKRIKSLNATINTIYQEAAAISEEAKAATSQTSAALETAILNQYEEYAISTSRTAQPEEDAEGWDTTAPEAGTGEFVWRRTVTIYGDGTKVTGEAVLLTGESVAAVEIMTTNGAVIRNSRGYTTMQAAVLYGGERITTTEMLESYFGLGASLSWKEKRSGDAGFTVVDPSDERLSQDGFALTVGADTITGDSTFMCELITID